MLVTVHNVPIECYWHIPFPCVRELNRLEHTKITHSLMGIHRINTSERMRIATRTQNTNNPTTIHTAATSITTAVYPTISRAFTLVIASSGNAQNGWSMLVS